MLIGLEAQLRKSVKTLVNRSLSRLTPAKIRFRRTRQPHTGVFVVAERLNTENQSERIPFCWRGFSMKVSIVTPTYNRGYIIRETLESLMNQSFHDFESIVVDDGSVDNTMEIVKGLHDERIRYIRHETNRGYSAACNTGIAAATGEFVAFLDSDDLWKPDWLERQVCFLSRHPDVDFVFTDVELIDREKTIPSTISLMRAFPRLLSERSAGREHVLTSRQMYLCLLEEVPIKTCAVLIRRETFGQAGVFNESWPSGTDWDLFLRISRSSYCGYIDLPLAVQRVGADSTLVKWYLQDEQFHLKRSMHEKDSLRGDREALAAVNRNISRLCRNLAGEYSRTGRRKESVSVCLVGFKETREPMMLLRAASSFMPSKLREALKRIIKGR